MSGHTPGGMSWSTVRTSSTRTPVRAKMARGIASSPSVWLGSGERFSVPLKMTRRRSSKRPGAASAWALMNDWIDSMDMARPYRGASNELRARNGLGPEIVATAVFRRGETRVHHGNQREGVGEVATSGRQGADGSQRALEHGDPVLVEQVRQRPGTGGPAAQDVLPGSRRDGQRSRGSARPGGDRHHHVAAAHEGHRVRAGVQRLVGAPGGKCVVATEAQPQQPLGQPQLAGVGGRARRGAALQPREHGLVPPPVDRPAVVGIDERAQRQLVALVDVGHARGRQLQSHRPQRHRLPEPRQPGGERLELRQERLVRVQGPAEAEHGVLPGGVLSTQLVLRLASRSAFSM